MEDPHIWKNSYAYSENMNERKMSSMDPELIRCYEDNKNLSPPAPHCEDYYMNSGNLIINYIPPSSTEYELMNLFKQEGPVENVKIVRKKPEGHSLGYAFIKYMSPADAHKAICKLNGYRLQNKVIKVSIARPSSPDIKDANLYISGIPKHLNQAHVHGTFSNFGKIVNCKIITDGNGQSKGIGFVRYNTKAEAMNAVQNLNKHQFPGSSAPLQVKLAEKPSHRNVKGGMYDEINKLLATYRLDPKRRLDPFVSSILKQYFPVIVEEIGEFDPAKLESSNESVCLYVYNLPPETDKAFLYDLFEEFGEIISVRPMIHYPTHQCKGFGFVNMRNYASANLAIQSLHGKIIKSKPLQVSLKK